jgi:hypothetical protein
VTDHTVSEGEAMPLYMDVHTLDAIDPDALAGAHERDLEVQDRYGVNYRSYWFSQNPAKVFCLVEAPSADAAVSVHKEAHGLVADEIFEVQPGD